MKTNTTIASRSFFHEKDEKHILSNEHFVGEIRLKIKRAYDSVTVELEPTESSDVQVIKPLNDTPGASFMIYGEGSDDMLISLLRSALDFLTDDSPGKISVEGGLDNKKD